MRKVNVMNTKDSILKRRSIRKFTNKEPNANDLTELVRLGRLYSSAANAQPVRFAIISSEENRDRIFPLLNWAKFLPDFSIEKEERPTAYILILSETTPSPFFPFDAGAAATTVMLAAEEMGLASCCLMIPKPEDMAKAVGLDGWLPRYAIALGYAAVESSATEWEGSQKYFTDEKGNFFVPKRSLEDVILFSDIKNN